jgi:hypothetical protein
VRNEEERPGENRNLFGYLSRSNLKTPMNLRTIKTVCLLSAMTLGGMPAALPAMTANSMVQKHVTEKTWNLLETRNGVSCYYQVGPLGTCNNAVLLKFVNASATAVVIDFSVTTDGVAVSRKITLEAGQTLDASKESSLSIRPASAGEPVISFTVSK